MLTDALAKFKHEVNGRLDFSGSGLNREVCRRAGHRGDRGGDDHRR